MNFYRTKRPAFSQHLTLLGLSLAVALIYFLLVLLLFTAKAAIITFVVVGGITHGLLLLNAGAHQNDGGQVTDFPSENRSNLT